MADAAQPIVQTTMPVRAFAAHEHIVYAVAVFPDGRRMVTGLGDNTLCLWDLKDDVVLKKMEGHQGWVWAVAVSRDERFIASGDHNGELIIWNGGTSTSTGESFTQAIKAHSAAICSLDFSPDGAVLATSSADKTTKLWSTETWKPQGNPIDCGDYVHCVRYSPSGELLAIATSGDIQIWNLGRRERIANFKAHAALNSAWNYSLAWTPDGTRLLSAGSNPDPAIQEWDTSTWEQVGNPCKGNTKGINTLVVNPTGTLVASVSHDHHNHHVRLWRLSDRRTIASFKHSHTVCCVTFSTDGKLILSGGLDKKISEWAVPSDAWPDSKILAMDSKTHSACMTGNLSIAEALLTQRIDADGNDHNSYANRSFVRARKADWDRALHDALKSVKIQPSFTGYISMGIALCGKRQVQDAMGAFDLATMFTDEHSKTILLLIKAIALFNANKHREAILRVQQLPGSSPYADILGCSIVEVYLSGLDGSHHNASASDFTAAINTIAGSSESAICSKYEHFVVLFGWDLKSLWQSANQTRCGALLRVDRTREALESYRYMMDMSDESTKASCRDWSTAFKQDCRARFAAKGIVDIAASGDAALAARDYNKAIELYSVVINLDSASNTIFVNRSKAKLEQRLWEDALLDAHKVIELSPSSYLGYQVKHAVLHAAQRYDEAIEALEIMLSKLDNAPDTRVRELRQKYVSRSDAEDDIQKVVRAQMENTPTRLLHTSTGRLHNQDEQKFAFMTSPQYKELVSLKMKNSDLPKEHIQDVVVTYFQYVMLSHRWEGNEPLLHDIEDKVVYELDPVGGIMKLQRFCETARDAGYRWSWSDTCCINKQDLGELPASITSMFRWYHHSALTIVYLSDVPPSSESGALARSAWITRGWTVQEFLAPNIVLFYQKDWTLYLDYHCHNHKECDLIMQEFEKETGIDSRALVHFNPQMRSAREKLQWASKRITTVPEDTAYSLFGIFDIQLSPMYGESKQHALGRLLQGIVAQSGDISVLDWVGESSKFNSCLPAYITSYQAPPYTLPSLCTDEMQTSTTLLRDAEAAELASILYQRLVELDPARFAYRRLQLPCIAFPVTVIRRRPGRGQCVTYDVKADGLRNLLITTKDKLTEFSPERPTRQKLLLVHPWNRLLELPEFAEPLDFAEPFDLADETESAEDYVTPPESPLHDWIPESFGGNGPVDPVARLVDRLGQPFGAFLLAQLRGREYQRCASDYKIIAQVKDMYSVLGMQDSVRTVEIL